MPDAVVLRKILLLTGGPVPLQVVCVHDAVDRDEGEQNSSARFCDADCLVDGLVDLVLLVEMVHRSEGKRHIEGVVRKPRQVRGIPLFGPKSRDAPAVFPKDCKVALHKLHCGYVHALFCKGDGVPSGACTDLQNLRAGLSEPMNVLHGHSVFQLSVARLNKSPVLTDIAVKASDNLLSCAHVDTPPFRDSRFLGPGHVRSLYINISSWYVPSSKRSPLCLRPLSMKPHFL